MTKKTPSTSPENQKNIGTILKSLESTINSLPEELQAPFSPIIAELIIALTGNTQSFSNNSKKIIEVLQNQVKHLLENRTSPAISVINTKRNVELREQINELRSKIEELENQLGESKSSHIIRNKQMDDLKRAVENQEKRMNFKNAIEQVLYCQSYEELFQLLENLRQLIDLKGVYFFVNINAKIELSNPYFQPFFSALKQLQSKTILFNAHEKLTDYRTHAFDMSIPAYRCADKKIDSPLSDKKIGEFALLFDDNYGIDPSSQENIANLSYAISHTLHILGERNVGTHFERKIDIDGLTQIYNRGVIDRLLPGYVEYSKRKEIPLGFFFFDLNNFKQINDEYGHKAGDDILKLFASFLDTTVKAFYQNFIPEYSPIIARQSGDEFQVILPKITLEMMENLTKDIHNGLKHIDYYAKSTKADSNNRVHRIPLLTSIGGSHWSPKTSQVDLERHANLIIQADRFLYKAKTFKGTSARTTYISKILTEDELNQLLPNINEKIKKDATVVQLDISPKKQ